MGSNNTHVLSCSFHGTGVQTLGSLFRIPQGCNQVSAGLIFHSEVHLGEDLLLSSDRWQDLCSCGYIMEGVCFLLAGSHPNVCLHFLVMALSTHSFQLGHLLFQSQQANLSSYIMKHNHRSKYPIAFVI